MRKALFLFLIFLALTIPAFATAVTVSATQLAGFNPSNIGGDRSITVTATTGSATVTSSAAFPPNIVGFGGFQVRIGGSQYTVSSVTSTSSLTLTANYGGSSGSQTMTLYKWVWFRWYALQSFTPLGNCVQSGVPCTIQPGTPGSGAWYIQMGASVVNNGQSNLLYIPSFQIDSTTDAASTADKYAKYSAAFYRVDNSLIQYYFCSSINQFSIPPTTPTSLVDLCTYNRATPQPPPPPATYYNTSQIDARFASCTANQGYYFATTGNAVSCLTFGSGLTLTGSTLTASGATAANVVQAYNVSVDGGCDKTGVSDVTSCVATALAAANSSGRPLYFPAGTYKANITIAGLNSLRIFGDGPGRTIIQSATGASPVIFANNATGLTHSLTIEEISLNGFNSGAADYGFRMSPDQPFDLTMRNVRINNTSDGGVYIPTNAFTMLFDGVDVTVTGGNGFDIFGDNTITFIRTYVHNVGTGGAAYRLRSGRFVLIGANGIDSGTNADWGLFGDTVAEDGADAYARVTLIGCNVEAFTNNGVRVKAGSQVSVHDTNFVSPGSGTITAIKMDNMSGVNPGVFDGLSGFALNGTAAWTNGAPINSAGVPFLFDGAPNPATYYDTGEAALVNIGYRSNALNGTNDRSTQYFNRIALGTSSTEGFDGNMYFVPDDTRTIGNSSPAGRPQHIYVGTGGVHVGTGSVPVEGQNWNVTGGTNPLIEFNNATVAGRFQLLAAGPYMQLGTTSNHAINFLTNNTARWVMNSSGHWIVDSGSLTIGLAAGNRPTIGYFSTSVNVGIPGTGVGSIVFGNGTNSNTFTLQSGATGSNLIFTLPIVDGTSGHCLKTNGSGTLSFASCTSGGVSLTATYVGYGNGSNVLTGTSDLAYSTSTKTLTITNGSGASTLALTGTSDTNAVTFGAGSRPGNQGGLIMPFVGGGNNSGPGIWWASSASYATQSGIYLNNGFTFQGANSTHDPVKIAEGTGTSSNGTVRYTFAPSSSLFTQTLSTAVTNTNHDSMLIDLSSTGTAAANFGAGMLVKLENGSSTQVDASRIRTYWTTATAGSETSAVAIGIQKAGGGVADVLTVTGDQYYGIRYTANITGAATIDLNNGNSQELTLTGNVTATTLSNLKAGGIYFIIFKQDGTGSRTLASTNIKAPGGSLTLTATAGARDLFVCTSDGTNLYCNKALDVR